MKIREHTETTPAMNILREWTQEPIQLRAAEDGEVTIYEAVCLTALVNAHAQIEIASEFNNEGNEVQIQAIKKELENLLDEYSSLI